MGQALLSREEVEQQKFIEKAGMINLYLCSSCLKVVLYFYVHGGVTPASITCNNCGGIADSQITQMQQPTRFWYRPNNLEELKALAQAAYEEDKQWYADKDESKVKEGILNNYIQHYNKGGLFAKSIRL